MKAKQNEVRELAIRLHIRRCAGPGWCEEYTQEDWDRAERMLAKRDDTQPRLFEEKTA